MKTVVKTILLCKHGGKNGVLTGFDIEKVAAYVYHINQEMPDASGGAAPQGEKAAWEK